jgi:hypothetical protein
LAEWLGSGLQNRVRRFESATDLNKKTPLQRIAVMEFLIFLDQPETGLKHLFPDYPNILRNRFT